MALGNFTLLLHVVKWNRVGYQGNERLCPSIIQEVGWFGRTSWKPIMPPSLRQ